MVEQDKTTAPPPSEARSPASSAVSPFTITRPLPTSTPDAGPPHQNPHGPTIDRPASTSSHHTTQARVLRQPFQFRPTTSTSLESPRSSTAPPEATPFAAPPAEQEEKYSGGIGRHTQFYGPIGHPAPANIISQVASAQAAVPQTSAGHAVAQQVTTAQVVAPRTAASGPTAPQPAPSPAANGDARAPAPTSAPPEDLEPSIPNPNIPPQTSFRKIPKTHYRSFHDPANPWSSLVRPDPSILNAKSPTYLHDKVTFNNELARYHGVQQGETHWFYPGGRCYGRRFGGKGEFGYHDPHAGVRDCKACERMQIPVEGVLRRIHEQYGGGRDGVKEDEGAEQVGAEAGGGTG